MKTFQEFLNEANPRLPAKLTKMLEDVARELSGVSTPKEALAAMDDIIDVIEEYYSPGTVSKNTYDRARKRFGVGPNIGNRKKNAFLFELAEDILGKDVSALPQHIFQLANS